MRLNSRIQNRILVYRGTDSRRIITMSQSSQIAAIQRCEKNDDKSYTLPQSRSITSPWGFWLQFLLMTVQVRTKCWHSWQLPRPGMGPIDLKCHLTILDDVAQTCWVNAKARTALWRPLRTRRQLIVRNGSGSVSVV
jgi:hypothetical protein